MGALRDGCCWVARVKSINESRRILQESCLVPFLQQLLENDSLLDVDRHASLYRAVFKVRCAILGVPCGDGVRRVSYAGMAG